MVRNECPFINDSVMTISGHFFSICMFIFHKSEVQTVILRCLTDLNLNWFKSVYPKCNYFHFHFYPFCKKNTDLCSVFLPFLLFCVYFVFALCNATFEPFAPLNDYLDLSFVKYVHVFNGKKWTEMVVKWPFISSKFL